MLLPRTWPSLQARSSTELLRWAMGHLYQQKLPRLRQARGAVLLSWLGWGKQVSFQEKRWSFDWVLHCSTEAEPDYVTVNDVALDEQNPTHAVFPNYCVLTVRPF